MNVTKAGPQPPRCVIEDCDRPPADRNEVYCKGHLAYFTQRNGTAADPPIVEADDPALLEAEARKAAAQEQLEYAERRRVRTWRTLENGTRVPEEYWTDEELAAMEEEAEQAVAQIPRNDPWDRPQVGTPQPDMAALEPHWDGTQWVLRPKAPDVDLQAVRSLVRDLMMELGIREEGG